MTRLFGFLLNARPEEFDSMPQEDRGLYEMFHLWNEGPTSRRYGLTLSQLKPSRDPLEEITRVGRNGFSLFNFSTKLGKGIGTGDWTKEIDEVDRRHFASIHRSNNVCAVQLPLDSFYSSIVSAPEIQIPDDNFTEAAAAIAREAEEKWGIRKLAFHVTTYFAVNNNRSPAYRAAFGFDRTPLAQTTMTFEEYGALLRIGAMKVMNTGGERIRAVRSTRSRRRH